MTTQVINDWLVKVGFDDSEVTKGSKRTLATMQKVAKAQNSALTKQERAAAKTTNHLRAQNALESKRLQLLRSIDRAKDLGLKTGGFTQSLRGGNPVRLEQRRLELEKLVTQEKRKQKDLAARATPQGLKARPRPKAFGLGETGELQATNKIDTVVRAAERGLGKTSEEFKRINAEAIKLKKTFSTITSKTGLIKLNNQILRLRERTTAATSAARRQTGVMESQKSAANNLRASILQLGKSYASIFAIIEGGRAFFRAGTEIESLKATFLAASGSIEEAGQNFEFVKGAANDIGISLVAAGKGYAKIAASAKGAGLGMAETNEIFLAAAESSRTFGLNAERTNLVFLAFSQILSKGKVSQEELRRQLGEQLPGVMTTAAKAMNVTTGELEKMIAAGIPAEDFLGKFSKQLRLQVRENGALSAAQGKLLANFDRFKNSLVLFSSTLFEMGGIGKSSGRALNAVGKLVKSITPFFTVLAKGISFLIDIITGVIDGVSLAIDIFTMFTGILIDGDSSIKDYTSSLRILIGMFKILGGVLLLPFALMTDMASIFDRFKDTIDTSSFAKFASTLVGVGLEVRRSVLLSAGDIGGAEFTNPFLGDKKGSEGKTINSNNTFSPQITVQGTGDPEAITGALDDWWNDKMRLAN